MLDLQTVFTQIYKGLEDAMSRQGFNSVWPEGMKKAEPPVFLFEGDSAALNYKGEKAKLRVLFAENKIYLLSAEPEADFSDEGAFSRLSTCLLELDNSAEKDVKFIIGEFSDTVTESFGKKNLSAKTKTPPPVSRAAAKSGTLSYDSNTLANRLAVNYPELKKPYQENIEAYGEFLAEDFFLNHGNAVVLNIIRENNAQKVKKLFSLLNEIYEDGTNEVQSLIVVTILGAVKNDPELIKTVLKNVSDSMMEPVIHVNAILAKSKSINMRLENPPKYKPKKKRDGLLSQLGL